MTAQPTGPGHGPDTGSYEVIHLGGHAAVVVPVADFMRLRALSGSPPRMFFRPGLPGPPIANPAGTITTAPAAAPGPGLPGDAGHDLR